jgi:hypothetical protein
MNGVLFCCQVLGNRFQVSDIREFLLNIIGWYLLIVVFAR